MPPVHRFPALPQPLRWSLGRRTRALDEAIRAWAATAHGIEHVAIEYPGDLAALMATDGFHPGPELQAMWAQEAAARVTTNDREDPQ